MLFIRTYFVQGQQYKIPRADVFQVCQTLDEYTGQVIVCQHHIPVVADGDGRGNYPCAVYVLLLHPVQSRCNAGQRLSASLFPLQQRIVFLEGKVDVMFLDLIQPDFLKERGIPQGEVIQPSGDSRVFIHFCIRHVLDFIFCPFPAKQTFITRIGFRRVFKDCLVDGHR